MNTGREIYEYECKQWPFYWNGQPRKTWEELKSTDRADWNKCLKPRTNPPFCSKRGLE